MGIGIPFVPVVLQKVRSELQTPLSRLFIRQASNLGVRTCANDESRLALQLIGHSMRFSKTAYPDFAAVVEGHTLIRIHADKCVTTNRRSVVFSSAAICFRTWRQKPPSAEPHCVDQV